MTVPARVRAVVLLVHCLVLAACGGGSGRCEAPRSPTPLDAAATGTITGAVRFAGELPAMKPLALSGECAARHRESMPAGDVLVRDGAVANAFVWVKDGLGERTFAVPETPVTIDQAGCVYQPRVAGVQTCQTIAFLNSDPLLHNVHGTPRNSSAWNFGLPVAGAKRTLRVEAPEVVVEVRCDVHPWMVAFLGVVDHPYFAVTGADGRFALKAVPPGQYLVATWHERFGTREAGVTLGTGETKDLGFTYGPN